MDADRALVEAVLAERPGAFEQVVRAYQGLCWHVIQRMMRHPEDTRDHDWVAALATTLPGGNDALGWSAAAAACVGANWAWGLLRERLHASHDLPA